MAAIDKSLPNVRQTIRLPNPQEVQKEQQEQTARNMMQPPVDVQKNEDGSVDVSFDPRAVNPGESKEHFANLAEVPHGTGPEEWALKTKAQMKDQSAKYAEYDTYLPDMNEIF